jgi:hypothetical protein
VQLAEAEGRAEVRAAAANIVNAADDHRTSRQKAASDRAEAERIRRHAASLTNEADLP